MDFRRLGRSGFSVPVLSLGTGTFCAARRGRTGARDQLDVDLLAIITS